MHTSSGAGYCDCGDEDAWTSGYACKTHERNKEESVALQFRVFFHVMSNFKFSSVQFSLPESLEMRLRGLTCLILQYSAKLICWEKTDVLPLNLTA